MTARAPAVLALLLLLLPVAAASGPSPAIGPDSVKAIVARLAARLGEGEAERIRLGVAQAAQRWWPEDGDAASFGAFCEENFVAAGPDLDRTFARLETVLEQVDGHLHEVRRELLTPLDLDTGPVEPVDRLLGNVDLAAHVDEDLFHSKVAFLALLNFPVHTLADRLARGAGWSREAWARSRLMDRFAERIPAAVTQEITRASTAADQYIAGYNVRMGRLLTPDGKRPFPDDLRLITHWGLRDELAAHYAERDGLAKQRMIQKVMERIVRQEIPAAVIDNPDVLWCPETNEVRPTGGSMAGGGAGLEAREPDTRYAKLLDFLRAERKADPYCPTAPTYIARRFELDRQIPEKEVEAVLVSVLESAEVRDLAGLIRKRLGRPLEPFDVWYSGFKPRGARSEEELDRIVREKYPTAEAFKADLPNVLVKLGFEGERARWLAEHVVVDPSRGAGHALGAVRRGDSAHLRTRVETSGMNYKGYSIALHEFGHNCEQVFSLDAIDHWLLSGVPNNAFTEALAFTFQDRDLEVLGLARRDEDARGRAALATLWAVYEIGGVSLVDMGVWNWMYAHPEAKPAELRQATLSIARGVWNRYYAPVFGVKDREILAIYSHMISYPLYLPDYAIGHIVAFEIGEKLWAGPFGAEFERMARQGRLTPDAWMRGAVSLPISPGTLLREARKAIDAGRE
ncbi:MAG: hypothetical protein LAO51_02065 [Acidobacteriia bacterium]|nr:hypothetical protein [Terriglobia bacterium]